MNTTNSAADLLNILTALTLIVPATISADEMDARDVEDAVDTWEFVFAGSPGATIYPVDGRTLRRW